jgi:hypothetical protein
VELVIFRRRRGDAAAIPVDTDSSAIEACFAADDRVVTRIRSRAAVAERRPASSPIRICTGIGIACDRCELRDSTGLDVLDGGAIDADGRSRPVRPFGSGLGKTMIALPWGHTYDDGRVRDRFRAWPFTTLSGTYIGSNMPRSRSA